MSTPTRIPVILSIDVEPEGRFLDPGRRDSWLGFERCIEFSRGFRNRVAAATGGEARLTWCLRMDPQITEVYGTSDWIVRQHQAAFDEFEALRDDVGLHTHPYRWDAVKESWVIDHGDQAWVDQCLDSAFDAFERALGRPCRTFRFGDRWMSNATVRRLEQLGVRHDLTLEPGQKAVSTYCPGERFTGAIPDYSGVPTRPYRPSTADYQTADAARPDGLWVIPLSTARVRPRALRWAYYRTLRRDLDSGTWTALVSHDPTVFRRIVADVLGRTSRPYLSLALRTGALAVPRTARRVEANLAWLVTHPMAGRFTWTTAADTLRLLELETPASLAVLA